MYKLAAQKPGWNSDSMMMRLPPVATRKRGLVALVLDIGTLQPASFARQGRQPLTSTENYNVAVPGMRGDTFKWRFLNTAMWTQQEWSLSKPQSLHALAQFKNSPALTISLVHLDRNAKWPAQTASGPGAWGRKPKSAAQSMATSSAGQIVFWHQH